MDLSKSTTYGKRTENGFSGAMMTYSRQWKFKEGVGRRYVKPAVLKTKDNQLDELPWAADNK